MLKYDGRADNLNNIAASGIERDCVKKYLEWIPSEEEIKGGKVVGFP